MRRSLLFAAILLVIGCNNEAEERNRQAAENAQRAADLQNASDLQNATDAANATAAAEEAARQQRACVLAAMNTLVNQPGDTDVDVRNRFESVGFQNCPNDFVTTFVAFRTSFARLVDKAAELRSQTAGGDDALRQGIGVTIFEAIFNTDTGATPYRDWQGQNSELGAEYRTLLEQTRQARQDLEVKAAAYGITFTRTPPATTNAM